MPTFHKCEMWVCWICGLLLNELVLFLFLSCPHHLATRSCGAEMTSQELKKEVQQHLKEKRIIEQSLPSSLVIGPFHVCVNGVRKSLSEKRKELATALLDHLALKLRIQVDQVRLNIFF